jgi:UDP-N-acetylmuramoylalanine--D-glutamate ligase
MMQTPIAIVGMGKSGKSAERLLLSRGFKHEDVLTFDQKAQAQFKDTETLLNEGKPRTLVVSPGVPLKSPWIQHAIKAGIKITSEINLACEALTDEKVIGITGSLGKSTTVSLLGAGLMSFDKNGFVGGNLGTPFCDYAFEVESGKRKKAQWILLELSSYQLENSAGLRLDHAAITYLSPNHMERYESLEEYYFTKWRIIHLTRGKLFLNKHGGDLIGFAQKRPELARCVVCAKENKELQPHALSHSALLGSHNQDNLALAAEIALACHWPISALQAMKSFKGLEHRLENVGVFGGVRFINDSKATAMDSVLTAAQVAHETLRDEERLFILIGGKDKNLPWEQLEPLAKLSYTHFLFFGESKELSRTKAKLPGEPHVSLDAALDAVFMLAKEGDVVLLSPGGTSFDEFKGFEDRGIFFKEKVSRFYSSKK